MSNKKTILVTGGAGFLGSHLCDRLINQGHYVFCLDNLFSGSKDNISHLLANPNFEFFHHDISTPFFLKVDEIYNLACPASPIYYQKNPVQTLTTCVLGALNTLELARRVKAKIFQASTSEVYGDPKVHPQHEDYWGNVNSIGIRSCYDEGKRCAETLFFDYHRQFKVDIRVARIFNAYGPRMQKNDGRVVTNFILQATQNKPVTIYGDGMQTRSFCYADDLIEGCIRMMENEKIIGPVNIGNPNEFTILELANKVIKLTDSKSEIIFKPLPQDDPKQRQPDISLAKKELNWIPRIELEEGLRKTICLFK
jgi:UDP-glucuronate decarboxylase